jgi:peptidoglycan/LPS O-acetylase OafA/YrhL
VSSNEPQPASEDAHIAVLDGLRGLAVLMVVAFHGTLWSGFALVYPTWPQKPVVSVQTFATTGLLGVQLFFFISGFVLFYPFARHVLSGARKPGWLEFAYRRFIKIVPSYWVALCATAFLRRSEYANDGSIWNDLYQHATFLHGFSDWEFISLGGVFWSLAVEAQFYVLFPAIALAMMRWPIQTWAATSAFALWYRGSAVANGTFTEFRVANGLPSQLDVFVTGMAGAYLFVLCRHYFARSKDARILATAFALAALGAIVCLLQSLAVLIQQGGTNGDPAATWRLQYRFILVLLFLAFTLGSAFSISGWRKLVANPVLVWIGVISYNLYLWHDTIMERCDRAGFPCALDPHPWTRGGWVEQYFAISVLLSGVIATALTYGFERPLLRLRPAWIFRSTSTPPEPERVSPAPAVALPPG